VLALVANRPPVNWTDSDFERFPAAADIVGRLFQEAAGAFHYNKDSNLCSLKATELRKAEQIADNIEKYLKKQDDTPKPEIIRAAIEILVQRIAVRNQQGQQNVNGKE
jgi:hypothetical protein